MYQQQVKPLYNNALILTLKQQAAAFLLRRKDFKSLFDCDAWLLAVRHAVPRSQY